MEHDSEDHEDQTEKPLKKPQRETGLDVHPVKMEPLTPLPATAVRSNGSALSLNDREQIYLLLIVLLVAALVGVSLIYASKFTIQR